MRKMVLIAMLVGTLAGCATDMLTECLQQCDGCCSAAGACQVGDTPSACGPRSTTCSVCTGTQTCSAGACVTPAATCIAPTDFDFKITASNAAWAGNTSSCTGSPSDLVPTGMALNFYAQVAKFHANGTTLDCSWTHDNCAVSLTCYPVESGFTVSNLVLASDMKSFTADVLIRRAGDMCNLSFKATGSY